MQAGSRTSRRLPHLLPAAPVCVRVCVEWSHVQTLLQTLHSYKQHKSHRWLLLQRFDLSFCKLSSVTWLERSGRSHSVSRVKTEALVGVFKSNLVLIRSSTSSPDTKSSLLDSYSRDRCPTCQLQIILRLLLPKTVTQQQQRRPAPFRLGSRPHVGVWNQVRSSRVPSSQPDCDKSHGNKSFQHKQQPRSLALVETAPIKEF